MEHQNLERGIQLFEIGRYEDAIPLFQNAIAENPNDLTSRYYIAFSLINTNQFNKAEEVVSSLRNEDPDNADAIFLASKVAFHLDEDKEALELIGEAISKQPYNTDYLAMKADILLHLKRFQEALGFANNALEKDAKHQHALNLRATILTKLDRKEEAAQTVENILNDNPENDYSHANVGWVALENGQIQKALNHFKEALAINPNFEYARQGMTTAIKSKNKIYALYLKYSFWIAKQSSKNQWFFLIGIYLVYRFSVKLLTNIGLTYIAIPLIAIYLTFALGSWIMEPLSNTILNFDKYGKYLLDKGQKQSGLSFGLLLPMSIIAAILFYLVQNDYFLVLAVTFLCLLIPFPRSFLLYSPKAKEVTKVYSFLMLLIGLVGPFFIGDLYSGLSVFILMVLYTWISNFFDGL